MYFDFHIEYLYNWDILIYRYSVFAVRFNISMV